MNDRIERVTLRVDGATPFKEGETPYDMAKRLVAPVVRPDATEWSVADVRFYCETVDITTPGDRLRHSVLGMAEWELTYEVLIPAAAS